MNTSKIMALAAASTFGVSGALAAQAQEAVPDRSVATSAGPIAISSIATGLQHPWGMAALPDGRLLVTQRDPGTLVVVDQSGGISPPLEGTPQVYAEGQGGLLDVALDPEFESNRFVYLSFAEPGEGGASTALGRGRLEQGRIADFTVLFRQEPKIESTAHFGGRIVFSPQGHVFLTLGERFQFEPAQELDNTLGATVRLNRDGSVPSDNPFVGVDDAVDAIWSYGHRNIESAAVHPDTGELWVAEMGPLGGDELNVTQPGNNYGWPVVSAGRHYDGEAIPDPSTVPRFTDAVKTWTPVISPSGMTFYSGDAFPQWRGSALIGSLTGHALVRLDVDAAGSVTMEEQVPLEARIRDVEQAADGTLYVLTDEEAGDVLRLTPLQG